MEQDATLTEVIHLYGWQPEQVSFQGNVCKIINEDGVYALKKSRSSREKLLVLHRLFQKLQENGYEHLLPWIPTHNGEPVASVESVNWYATPWKEPDADFPNTDIVRGLAEFHHEAEPLISEFRELRTKIGKEDLEEWKLKKDQLDLYQESAKMRDYPSPFDKVYLRGYEQLQEPYQFFLRGMEKFVDVTSGKPPRYTICHTRIHPSNILSYENGFSFIDFDNVRIDTPVRDLATYMRRYIRDQGDQEHPSEILEAYEEKNKLQGTEKRLLALYLAYPERLMKYANRYYETPSYFSSEADATHKLEAELWHFEQLWDFARRLWQSTKKKSTPPKSESKARIKKILKR
ncbi:phosphotransferase [Hazenella sp. IB182353]|uniref:phosphotransferase n=1 Tax=Polycladospora coralii TaxID=2771432 RepID=UPI001747CB53|nr:phosphotransferase [Polycladospora coralii]MBS7529254.1 phosphotransferase [Polycladospora coralii]